MTNLETLNSEPHRRFNILTNSWVLVSPHRTKRPWQGKVEDDHVPVGKTYDENCYLCPGNERAGGHHNEKYTDTYVFTNDFAAIKPNLEAD
ncbi:MAG: galactose-1-phosphate uridylyltransferase, partial [Cryomorphaceae bacterium]